MSHPITHFIARSLVRARAFTLVEVLIASLLVCVGIGSIVAMNAESLHTLRAARQAAVASQLLQQRVEQMRNLPWAHTANATALAELVRTATASEQEFAGEISETIDVSPLLGSERGPEPAGSLMFRVSRRGADVRIERDGDLALFGTLLVESTVRWIDRGRPAERSQRCVICRAGLTRSGIFGGSLGRVRRP